MARIDHFRQTWPYDYRILPLAYQWGDKMKSTVQQQLLDQAYPDARKKLDRIWALVPLTPELDALQQQLDQQSPPVALDTQPARPADLPLLIPDYVGVDDSIHRQFRDKHEDNSPALAQLELDGDAVAERNTDIESRLIPLCQAAVKHGASAIIHAEDRVDYHWLTVRLTLCIRRLDRSFRLRHSYRQADGVPVISLHPPRKTRLPA